VNDQVSGISLEAQEENVRMIRESAGFLRAPDRMAAVRAARHIMPGITPADRDAVVSMGWLGMRLPEERGGVGFGLAEFCALSEELGRGLLPEFVVQAMAIAPLLPDAVLEQALSGERIVIPAWNEKLGDPDHVEAALTGGAITGTKRFVLTAAAADSFLVTTAGGAALVDAGASGLSLSTLALQDGGHFGELALENAAATPVEGDVARAREEAMLGMSAYLLGMAERTFEITKEYLAVREQFNRPIGSFQALQHRMVDMYLQIELTRAAIGKTARLLDDAEADREECLRAVSRTKARASDMVLLVTREGVQMHGGMGYTDDCDVGLFLRKAMIVATGHGSAGWHRRRYARLADLANNRLAA